MWGLTVSSRTQSVLYFSLSRSSSELFLVLRTSFDLHKSSQCPERDCAGGDGVTPSRPTLAILWTIACQAHLSMGFPTAKILMWVGISFSRGSPNTGIEPGFPASQADSLLTELQGTFNERRQGHKMGRM